MFAEVKKCADNHDIKGLHYIFVDCLDVDPTFDKYREDYLYCKEIEDFFDSHVEMTPIFSDKNRWSMAYWEQLKLDLVKNFSQRRFEHMIQVAKVVYSDKIERLLAERESKKEPIVVESKTLVAEDKIEKVTKPKVTISEVQTPVQPIKVQADKQQEDLLAKKRALELQNQRIEREQQEQRARIAAAQKADAEKKAAAQNGQYSKKLMGVTLAVLAIVVLIVVLVLIKVL